MTEPASDEPDRRSEMMHDLVRTYLVTSRNYAILDPERERRRQERLLRHLLDNLKRVAAS